MSDLSDYGKDQPPFAFSVSVEGKVKNVQKSQMWLLESKEGMVGVTVLKNLANWKSAR